MAVCGDGCIHGPGHGCGGPIGGWNPGCPKSCGCRPNKINTKISQTVVGRRQACENKQLAHIQPFGTFCAITLFGVVWGVMAGTIEIIFAEDQDIDYVLAEMPCSRLEHSSNLVA